MILPLLLAAGTLTSADARADAAPDLAGTWYLLVHYVEASAADATVTRDGAAASTASEQWRDAVWRLQRSASGLTWTEYVRVAFRDDESRTQSLPGERPARSEGAWEPSARQLAEIAGGVAFDDHGSRSQRLRGSDSQGYRSSGGLRSGSASAIGYQESWRIDAVRTLPVFIQEAAMGAARTESLSGTTRYTTESIHAGGDRLEGRYERDGTERGHFRLYRMGTGAAPPAPGGSPR